MSEITPEERALLKKVHRQRWDIDEGDMSIYRDIDGELTCKLATGFEGPEKIARELSQVWQSAWPIVVRLETAIKAADARAEKAEAEVARLTKERDWLADKLETGVSCPRGDLDLECPFGTSPGSETCTNIIDAVQRGEASWTHCWKEAARKAVAAGEGKE